MAGLEPRFSEVGSDCTANNLPEPLSNFYHVHFTFKLTYTFKDRYSIDKFQ